MGNFLVSRKHFPIYSSIAPGSSTFLTPLHEPWETGVWCKCHVEGWVFVFSAHWPLAALLLPVLIVIYYKKTFLWWGLTEVWQVMRNQFNTMFTLHNNSFTSSSRACDPTSHRFEPRSRRQVLVLICGAECNSNQQKVIGYSHGICIIIAMIISSGSAGHCLASSVHNQNHT